MEKHMKVRHETKEQPRTNSVPNKPGKLNCEQCDFKGKSKLQMEKHLKVRHGFRAYSHPVRAPPQSAVMENFAFFGPNVGSVTQRFAYFKMHAEIILVRLYT